MILKFKYSIAFELIAGSNTSMKMDTRKNLNL